MTKKATKEVAAKAAAKKSVPKAPAKKQATEAPKKPVAAPVKAQSKKPIAPATAVEPAAPAAAEKPKAHKAGGLLPLDEMLVRLNHNARSALVFKRDETWTQYLGFESTGPVIYKVHTGDFDNEFTRVPIGTTVEGAALTFFRALKSAYTHRDEVAQTLLEIFNMTATKPLAEMSLTELADHYNKLAAAASKPTLSAKSFKSKGDALKRIADLGKEATAPTEKQVANKVAAAAEAEKRLAPVKAKRADEKQSKAEERAAAKAKREAVAKAARVSKAAAKKAAPSSGEKKPRGQGIGAFCMELIKKGKDNEAVLEAVKKKFPDASTSASSVAWYRNKLKQDGELDA